MCVFLPQRILSSETIGTVSASSLPSNLLMHGDQITQPCASYMWYPWTVPHWAVSEILYVKHWRFIISEGFLFFFLYNELNNLPALKSQKGWRSVTVTAGIFATSGWTQDWPVAEKQRASWARKIFWLFQELQITICTPPPTHTHNRF